ncbi:MAG TPA: hypothetical protein PKV72_06770, partial [Candidatus Peribacteria bacterium]|nr:hypothetical protein [Candidatus Peribacteria bacterium]
VRIEVKAVEHAQQRFVDHQLIGKAQRLEDRFNTLQKQYKFTYLAGKTLTQQANPEAATPPDENKDEIDELEGALESFDTLLNQTDSNAAAAADETPDTDPLATELAALRADIAKLRQESEQWRKEEAGALGIGAEATPAPADFTQRRVDDLQRLIDAFLKTPATSNAPPASQTAEPSGQRVFKRLVDTLANSRRANTPMRTPTVPPAPVLSAAVTAPATLPTAVPRSATLSATVSPTPSVEARVTMPDNEPWPTNQAEFRRQFTYTAERFGSRENYARHLATRLNTPERINQFLENMFTYTQARDMGQRQRIVNAGRDRYEQNEKWVPPLEFLTTYDAGGKLHGDCDDIALAFAYIRQLQGKPAFAIETSTSETGALGGLQGKGHVLCASFEPDGSVHIIDTTGIEGKTDATVQITQRRPGETDEQLLARAYQTATNSGRRFDSSAVAGVISMPNGDGFNLPGNLAFVRRHNEIQPMLEARNYRGVLGIIDQEIARDPTNLSLRLSKIQMLVLANAGRSEITAVVDALKGPPAVERHTPFNQYSVNTTRRVLLEQSPQYV